MIRLLLSLCFLPQVGFAQFNWQHTDGPFGSRSYPIVSSDHFAFLPAGDFLYRSSNGMQWEKIDQPVSTYLAVYKDTLVNLIYNEATDTLSFQISTDHGQNWTSKRAPASIRRWMDIVMCRYGIYWKSWDDNLLYSSTDQGTTWTTDTLPIPDGFHRLRMFDDQLYLAGNTVLLRRDSVTESWEDIKPVMPQYEYVGAFEVRDNHILLSSENYLFDSHDDGLTWTTTPSAYSSNSNRFAYAGQYVYTVADTFLLRSPDNGIHWDTLTVGNLSGSIRALYSFGDLLLVSTPNKGVFRLDAVSNQLIESNDGLTKGTIYDLCVGNNKIWAACGNGLFAFDIPTQKWSEKANLPLPFYWFAYISTNDLGWVAVTDAGSNRFYLSLNDGLSWDTILFDANGNQDIERVQLIGDVMFLFSGFRVFRSVDLGLHWEGLGASYFRFPEILAFKGKLYLADFFSGLFTSEDNGVTWQILPLSFYPYEVHRFGDLMYCLARSNNGVELYTSDDGLEWILASVGMGDYSDNLSEFNYQPAFFFRDAEHHYGFMGWQGHYTSDEDFDSWSELPAGLTGYAYAYHDNIIYLGHQGMYQSIIENPYITAVDDVTENANTAFTLSPNPANDLITVTPDPAFKFQNPVRIHSSDGKLMKSIVTSPDSRQIDIIISDFPDGMYFVSLLGEHGLAVNSFVKVK
ncbi:MAG TPA: T9SS type A sorting domain-containing protein [Saprospiraceae bacterium]|nr:T9SS type A sorting domain-containing protein [Saprospiraceae bacterium]